MTLSVRVFNTGYTFVDGGPGWDNHTSATWPSSTASLIAGDRDAVLVDALMTIEQGRQLVSWIGSVNRNLTNIAITHGHGDHFFGAGPVLRAFPAARLLALNDDVIREARLHLQPEIMSNWIGWFGDRFDHAAAVPVKAGPEVLELEGTPLSWLAVGGADGTLATVIHVAELDTVLAGDAVYNDIHMWLWNSTPESRATWLATIDAVAELKPRTIIAGHRDQGAADDEANRQLAQSRRYIEDFDRAVGSYKSASQLIDTMMTTYGNYGNPYSLFLSAYSQFPS
jgi:glyoxylase-like metal-dependent hydrolase (beta-lactamase superfamily II)